ncbi:MAG: hypothetical protein ACI4R9_02920 [Kiritimatiellia bacterium]
MPDVRCEVKRRMTRRCDGWDYRARAIYQITLVQADRRRPLLGRLVIDDPAAAPEAVAAHVEPSALGEAILAHWKRLGAFTSEIRPLFCEKIYRGLAPPAQDRTPPAHSAAGWERWWARA